MEPIQDGLHLLLLDELEVLLKVFPLRAEGAAVTAAVLEEVADTVILAEVTEELCTSSSVLVCPVAVDRAEAVDSVVETATVVVAEASALRAGRNMPAPTASEHKARHNATLIHDLLGSILTRSSKEHVSETRQRHGCFLRYSKTLVAA